MEWQNNLPFFYISMSFYVASSVVIFFYSRKKTASKIRNNNNWQYSDSDEWNLSFFLSNCDDFNRFKDFAEKYFQEGHVPRCNADQLPQPLLPKTDDLNVKVGNSITVASQDIDRDNNY